jgi:hypothetical protein
MFLKKDCLKSMYSPFLPPPLGADPVELERENREGKKKKAGADEKTSYLQKLSRLLSLILFLIKSRQHPEMTLGKAAAVKRPDNVGSKHSTFLTDFTAMEMNTCHMFVCSSFLKAIYSFVILYS